MDLSRETLSRVARDRGFVERYLEKVVRLGRCLELMHEHETLKDQILLKGGTALNLFYFRLPRLSVDLDLNFVGAEDVEEMLDVRPGIIRAMEQVFERLDLSVVTEPDYDEHAGLTWELSYERLRGGRDKLKVDLNFLMRVPLFPKQERGSNELRDLIPVRFWTLDLHEIAAGKLRALFQRYAARDLYDVHRLLSEVGFDRERLRLAFVVYGAAVAEDWREIALEDIGYELGDLERNLLPVLRTRERESIGDTEQWAREMVGECRERMSLILPLNEAEQEFLTKINEEGSIQPELLTQDPDLQARIQRHPALKWKVKNVRDHFDLGDE